MRKIAFFIVFTIIIGAISFSSTGCTEKKTSANDSDSVSIVKPAATTDTIDQIIAEAPVPKAADELFDDFIFNFAANRKLQMKRITFPLPVTTRGNTSYITAKRWKMEHFFMHQEFYTLIFDNMKQMNVVKDTTIDNAIVEKINLQRNSIKQYIFKRIDGQWMMTGIVNGGISKSKNASFLRFYHHFANDSIFQVNSINDPLDFTGPSPDDDFSDMTGILSPEQWPSFAPELPKDMIYNIIYGNSYTESSKKIFVIRGIANGLETELTFQKKSGKWKLTKIIM